MHRIFTPLLTGVAVLISTITLTSTPAFSQTVSLTRVNLIPSPEARVTGAPVFAKDNHGYFCQAVATHPAGGSNIGDWVVAKYFPTGAIRWTLPFFLPGRPDLTATATTMDAAGSVIVAGTVKNNADTEAVVAKWDTAGNLQWSIQLRLGQSLTAPSCMATDTFGNIYIGGTVRNSVVADSADFFLLRLTSAGNMLWSRTYNGTAGKSDQVTAIAADPSGEIYITGASMGAIRVFNPRGGTSLLQEGYDYATLKYSAGGELYWARRYSTTDADIPTAITLDAANRTYVTGSSANAGTTVCYDNSGNQQWALISTTAQNNTSIALDPSGNVVTAGYAINSGYLNYILTKSTAAGSLTWSTTANAGPYVPYVYGPTPALTIDKESYIYISGESIPLGAATFQNFQFLTQRYSPSGQGIWTQYYSYGSGYGNIPSCITTTEPAVSGPLSYPTVFVGGFIAMTGDVYNLGLLTYAQTVTIFTLSTATDSVNAKTASLTASLNTTPGLANYPNPFRGATSITYTLPHDSHVTLRIYDLRGRTLATPINDNEPAGLHTLPFNAAHLAPGVYEYRLIATSPQGNYVATKQMIIQ